MGHLRPLAAILLLSVAACGDDGGGNSPGDARIDSPPADTRPVDSGPVIVDANPAYDLSCYQNTAPTTAPATITIAGTAQGFGLSGAAPLAGVTIKACKGDCVGANDLGSVGPTAANGTFTTPALTTGGTPIAGYLVATDEDHLTTYLFPHAALNQSLTGAPLVMVDQNTVNQLGGFTGDDQLPSNGIVGVAVTDCGGTPMAIAGSSVTVKDGGGQVAGDPPFDVGALIASAAGTFLVTNVPPGNVTVTATYAGKTFLANTVRVVAGAVTTAQVKPGY